MLTLTLSLALALIFTGAFVFLCGLAVICWLSLTAAISAAAKQTDGFRRCTEEGREVS